MQKDVIIRDATKDDLVLVDRILVDANLEFRPCVTLEIWESWQENMRESARSEKGELIIIELKEKIAGIVQFFPDATYSTIDDWPQGSACIRLMGVLPQYRGRGLGKLLIEECIKRASKANVPTIYLQTGKMMHAAHKLYEKCGFKVDPRFDENPFGTCDCTVAYRYDL